MPYASVEYLNITDYVRTPVHCNITVVVSVNNTVVSVPLDHFTVIPFDLFAFSQLLCLFFLHPGERENLPFTTFLVCNYCPLSLYAAIAVYAYTQIVVWCGHKQTSQAWRPYNFTEFKTFTVIAALQDPVNGSFPNGYTDDITVVNDTDSLPKNTTDFRARFINECSNSSSATVNVDGVLQWAGTEELTSLLLKLCVCCLYSLVVWLVFYCIPFPIASSLCIFFLKIFPSSSRRC